MEFGDGGLCPVAEDKKDNEEHETTDDSNGYNCDNPCFGNDC